MAFPILALAVGAGVIALVAAHSKAGAAPGGGPPGPGAGAGGGAPSLRGFQSGQWYRLTVRSSISTRTFGPDAARQQLAGALGPQGFDIRLCEPDATDPYVYRITGPYSGSAGTLHDAPGVILLGLAAVAPMAGGGAGSVGKYDRNLPPELEITIDRMVAGEPDGTKLRDFADSLRALYPIAAAQLDTAANARSFTPPGAGPPQQPPPPVGQYTPPPQTYPPQPPREYTPPPDQGPPNPYQPPSGYTPPPLQPYIPPVNPFQPPAPPANYPPLPPVGPAPGPIQMGPQGADAIYDPGPLQKMPAIPAAGKAATAAHRTGQTQLVVWARTHRPTGSYSTSQVDGVIGPTTQRETQIFQAWSNAWQGTHLTLDGLFGPETYAALAAATGAASSVLAAPPPAIVRAGAVAAPPIVRRPGLMAAIR